MTYRVPTLGLPDSHQAASIAHLAECDAVRLFVERAALGQPGFTVTPGAAPAILQICQQLDGIPLAIEFAAARVKVLSVEQIAARLADRFRLLTGGPKKTSSRHQTLRTTLDWSYDLLSEHERALLRRLSVFAGGSTLEAIEAICATGGVESSRILDLLGRLVDKSLLLAEPDARETRYRLLGTVRQYAQDKLVEEGIADRVRRAHRDRYLALAEKAAPELHGSKSDLWMERLETEHDNLRAALEWSRQDPGGAEAGLRLACALDRFWYFRGHWDEALRWLEAALTRSSGAPRSAVPKVLFGLVYIAWHRGDTSRASTLREQGLLIRASSSLRWDSGRR